MKTLIKTDKNGTKTFVETKCPKCGGAGYIAAYGYIDGGVCFKCGGTGHSPYKIVERTDEYERILSDRRLAKSRKNADADNLEIFHRHGFNAQGETWVVMGDTFSIRAELKAAGAKYTGELGWAFDHEVDTYPVRKVTKDDRINGQYADTVMVKCADWHYRMDDQTAIHSYIAGIRDAYNAEHTPAKQYMGTVGDKLTITAVMENLFTFESRFGTSCIYKFKTVSGDVAVWKTNYQSLTQGVTYELTGTVKAQEEYKGEKQTILTRCKYKPV